MAILRAIRDSTKAGALTAAQIAKMVTLLAATVLLGRALGPESVGNFSILLTFSTILQVTTLGGLAGAALHRLLDRSNTDDDPLNPIIGARLILIPPLFLGGAIAYYLTSGADLEMFPVCIFFLGYAIGSFDVPEILLSSQGKFMKIGMNRIIVVAILCGPKLWMAGTGNLGGLVLVQAVEAALWQLCLFPASKITRRSISGSARDLRAGLRQLAEFRKLWASGVVATVSTRIDVILVGVLAGTFAAGQYATASRIVEALTLLAVALSTVRFNALIEASNDSRRYLAESGSFARLMVGIGVTSMVVLALAGPPMVIILYGNEFAPAASVLALYSLTAVPIFYRQFISRVLIIERSYGLSLACNVFTLALNVSLNLTLVPQFGAMGAATAAVLTYPLGIIIPFMATRNGRDILSLSALTIVGTHMRAKTAATRLVHERSNNASFQNTRAIKAG